jgi:hypothetical protein
MDDKNQADPATELAAAFRAFTDAFGRAAQAWLERHRPFFEAMEKVAQDPAVRAYLEARERGEVPSPRRPCHCLCGHAHPDDKGVCDANAVTTRRFETAAMGPVDVALCAPCVVAQGITALQR